MAHLQIYAHFPSTEAETGPKHCDKYYHVYKDIAVSARKKKII